MIQRTEPFAMGSEKREEIELQKDAAVEWDS